MTVLVCVGSSCHLKGSYDIVEALKNAIKEHSLEDIFFDATKGGK